MPRRAALVTFVSAILLVVACGRQITPEPSASNSNLAGHMVIRFRTVGSLNFQKYDYAIVFNTCGSGTQFPTTPYPNAFATTFNNYSFSFNVGTVPIAGGATTVTTAFPVLFQYFLTPGTSNNLNPQNVPISPSLTALEPNSNGQGTEFTLTFDRQQLANPLNFAKPCPLFSLPTPGAGATPNPQATVASQTSWAINFFTISPTGGPNNTPVVLDSLGSGGASDVTYNQSVIDTTSTNAQPVNKASDIGGSMSAPPTDTSAAIAGGEIDNYL